MPNLTSFVHGGDAAYAAPVLRAPSPSSSIGTDYGEDQTTAEEADKPQILFMEDVDRELKLHLPRPEEIKANCNPLLPKPTDQQQELRLYFDVMRNLRHEVKKLQDNDLFEQTILRGSLVTEQQELPSGDIDAIMRSMMKLSPRSPGPSMAPPMIPGLDSSELATAVDDPLSPPSLVHTSTPVFRGPDLSQFSEIGGATSTPGRRSTRIKRGTRRV